MATIELEVQVNGATRQGNLATINLTQPAKTPPDCMACMPNCLVCSSLYVCETCSSGHLIGGLCITKLLSSSLGVADSTTFSFDTSDSTSINSHINSQLGLPSSTSQVSFTYAKLVYPDASLIYLTDPSSFKVPILQIEGVTSFGVTFQLVFTVNGESKQGDVTVINLTQPVYVPPDVCGCRLTTECNTLTRKCECE